MHEKKILLIIKVYIENSDTKTDFFNVGYDIKKHIF